MPYFEITNIDKPDRDSPHEAIRHVQGPAFGIWTLAEAVSWAKISGNMFYVRNPLSGTTVYVGVVRGDSNKREHLRTYADGVWSNNLLSLPPISVSRSSLLSGL